jgi:putative ABC transport system ATP-binding protein
MADSPTASDKLSLSNATLAQLAAITGSEFDHERARVAVQNAVKADADPLARLVSAAAEVYMKVTPVRQPLAEVLWHARQDLPVVIWSEKEQRWIVVTFAGWFRLRIADGDHPTHRLSLSRSELVRLLGLKNVNEVVEAGVVHPERPAHVMSVHADAEHHEHHEHVSPERRFFRLLKAERQDIVTLLIFSVFSGILYLAAPLAVDSVVSNLAFGGQAQPYVQAIVVLALALFGALGLQAVVSGFQYYISDIIQRRIFVRTAADLAYRLPRVKAQSLDEVHAPELVNRFLDVVTAQKSTALLLLDGVNLIFSSLIGMLLLALYHPLMLMFVVILLALIALSMWLLGKGAVKHQHRRVTREIRCGELVRGDCGLPLRLQRPRRLSDGLRAGESARHRVFAAPLRPLPHRHAADRSAAGALRARGGCFAHPRQLACRQPADHAGPARGFRTHHGQHRDRDGEDGQKTRSLV